MALKVVPAGDERCDIHNGRKPAAYICKSCLKELGVEEGRAVTVRRGPIRRARRALRAGPIRQARRAIRRSRSRGDRRILIGTGIALLIGAILVVVVLAVGGGGSGTKSGPPSEADVVDALDLSPNPSGTGWITLDGACAVLSIDIGSQAQSSKQSVNPAIEATNEDGTVRAVVQNYYSASQAACVDRIRTALRDHY